MTLFGHTWRILLPMFFFLVTFNSTEYNIVNSALYNYSTMNPFALGIMALLWIGVLLFLLNVLFDSLGKVGVGILSAIFVCIIGYLVTEGILNDNVAIWFNLVPIMLGLLMGIGIISSYYYKKITNRLPVDGGGSDTGE